jgi:hypothetical protein
MKKWIWMQSFGKYKKINRPRLEIYTCCHQVRILGSGGFLASTKKEFSGRHTEFHTAKLLIKNNQNQEKFTLKGN